MNSPLVSIILPVYNTEEFIKEAIESALNQDYNLFELIIINDGSTDSSVEIIKSFSDKRIRYFEQPNLGVSAARNIGLTNMKGDFFCFLDADDLMTSNSLSSRLTIFEADPKIEFIDGKVQVFNSSTKNIKRVFAPRFHGNPHNRLLSLSSDCFFGPTWMIRKLPGKKYQFKVGLTHVEDLLFYISISAQGIYSFSNEVVYKYRSGNNSAMKDLLGLENSYFSVYNELKYVENRYPDFKKKIRSIMFKSYISKFRLINAAKVIFREK